MRADCGAGPRTEALDERLSGTRLIVDIGYVSHALLRRAAELDIQLVIRLKKGWATYLDVSGPGELVADWKFPASIEECFDGETRLRYPVARSASTCSCRMAI